MLDMDWQDMDYVNRSEDPKDVYILIWEKLRGSDGYNTGTDKEGIVFE